MFRFFRHIRQAPLRQGNFGKYFLYISGEVLLVVAGILIALSINNSKEEAKYRKNERLLLEEIRDDLEKTLDDLNWDLERHMQRLDWTDRLLNNLIYKQGYQDTLFNNLLDISTDYQLYTKSGAFESLKSSGLSQLSNNTLRLKITNLYQVQIERVFSKGKRQTESLSIEVMLMPFIEKHYILTADKNPYLPELREIQVDMPVVSLYKSRLISYESLRNDQAFLNMLQTALINRRNKVFDHLVAKQETLSTIEAIEKELERFN